MAVRVMSESHNFFARTGVPLPSYLDRGEDLCERGGPLERGGWAHVGDDVMSYGWRFLLVTVVGPEGRSWEVDTPMVVTMRRGSGEGDTLMVVAMRCGKALKVPVDATENC